MAINEKRVVTMLRATPAQLTKIYLAASLASAAAERELRARGLPVPVRKSKKG